MNHQDWKEIVLHKRNPKNNEHTKTVKHYTPNKVKDIDITEGNTIKYVSNDLKKKIENVRLSLRNQQDRSISRDEFARNLNVSSKIIQLLETGKLTEKEAKQIALKIEKIYKIKIL